MPVWMIVVEWAARIILLLLVGLSIWSIQIMLERRSFYRQLLDDLPESNWDEHLRGQVRGEGFWHRAYAFLNKHRQPMAVDRAFETFHAQENKHLEKGLSVLGSLGATAPFIGLLGTVLGIINAFGDLSMNSQNTNKIMFMLAEALILTAMGLAVAIPAVLAFNHFNRKRKEVWNRLTAMKNTYQNTLSE
jgi:biopolymer transport protein ExbB